MIARNAVRRRSRSLRNWISVAMIESYFAWASLVSVIVAVPTSKLRLACASCSATASFCCSTSSTLNSASSTSKYATAVRMMRSCCAIASE